MKNQIVADGYRRLLRAQSTRQLKVSKEEALADPPPGGFWTDLLHRLKFPFFRRPQIKSTEHQPSAGSLWLKA